MLSDEYVSAIEDAEHFLKTEVYPLMDNGLSLKEVAKQVKKKRIASFYSRLFSIPSGNQTGEQLLHYVRMAVSDYRRTQALARGIH